MRRLAALAAVCSMFAFGFTSCDPGPKFTCANPQVLTGPQDGIAYPGSVRVNMNQWTGVGAQTMYVCAPGNWKAVANQSGAPETGVKTYPDSERTFTNWSTCTSAPTLGSFSTLTGYERHAAPAAGSWNAAWDLFVGGTPCSSSLVEIMVWDQFRGISVPPAQDHPVIAGTAFDLYHSGGYFQFRRHTQTTEASVNLLAILRYLQGRGFLQATDRLQFAQMGFEILTTGGIDRPFWLTGFSVNAVHS